MFEGSLKTVCWEIRFMDKNKKASIIPEVAKDFLISIIMFWPVNLSVNKIL